MFDVSDKVVVITGAVGNLGMAVAQTFMNRRARAVLVDRTNDRLRAAFPQLINSPNHLLAGDVDLASADSVSDVFERAIRRFGRIDGLVNTVGGFRGGKRVHEEHVEDWDFLFDINVRTTLNTCRAAIPHMLRHSEGRIINVASRAALAGEATLSAYCASKSAVVRLTETLAQELKRENITANCVLPGTIDTPQNRQAMPDADHNTWISPEAIAEVIVFLASDSARAVTGAAIPVFGKG